MFFSLLIWKCVDGVVWFQSFPRLKLNSIKGMVWLIVCRIDNDKCDLWIMPIYSIERKNRIINTCDVGGGGEHDGRRKGKKTTFLKIDHMESVCDSIVNHYRQMNIWHFKRQTHFINYRHNTDWSLRKSKGECFWEQPIRSTNEWIKRKIYRMIGTA